MFQKILFTVGDDGASDAAVPVVGACARRLGANVHVLHVHLIGEDPGNGELRRKLQSVQERLHAEVIHGGGEVRLARSSRGMATVITRAAAETGAKLVAVGSRGVRTSEASFLAEGPPALTALTWSTAENGRPD
jgi:nucleotide-binding universal stress UspA family protein